MAINKDFEDFFKCLKHNQTEYLVIGGYAHIYYTEPRYTKDLDILVNPTKENSVKVYKTICQFFGTTLKEISPDSFVEINKPAEIVYGIGNPPNRIDILTSIPGVKFSSAWERKTSFKYGQVSVWVINRKDLEKNFKEVRKLNSKLNHKYGYFLDKLKG